MTGPEVAVASAATRVLFTQGAYDFFFKWKLDELLLDRLKALVNSTKSLLTVADMRRQIQENSISDEWFKKARFAICDAEDVFDKIFTDVQKQEYRMGDSPGTGLIVKEKLRYKGKDIVRSIHPCKKTREAEMRKLIEKLESIASEVSHLGLDSIAELAAIREARGRPTSSVNDTITIFGRSDDKKNIMKLLESRDGVDDALRIIPIVGLPGVGKTTLANMIFHECISLTPPMFDVNAWVCLSDEFKVEDVIKSVLEFITRRRPELDGLDSLQQELKRELQGKKFLLILDDIWNKDSRKWDELRTPFLVGKPGSRIIVTTRNIDIAESLTRGYCHLLNVMSEDESWSLFESLAFPDGSESASPALKKIGREIVDKCNGLPLAIKMIGRQLTSFRNDVIEWKRVLNSEIWSSKSKILPSLWLSYHHLPQHIQQCFAYFSLFPKDYEFQMEGVVVLWVAEGFIERTTEIEQQEYVARGYFNHLLLSFFIQESSRGKPWFILHNLVHDLAEYVSRGLCVDLLDVNLQSRRLCYIQGEDEMLLYKSKVQKLRLLRTLLPMAKIFRVLPYLDNKILNDVLSNFKLLRVLSLKGYSISVLPASVGDMKLLRYMNISMTDIEYLPQRICRLYNLQFLILRDCHRLKRLPADIVDLVNLRYLNVHGTKLEEMPNGIGTMKNLQMLPKLVLGEDKSKHMKELKDLTSLHGELHISGLNNITDPEHVVAAQFGRKEYLEELVLDWGRIAERDTTLDESVLDAIQAHANLKKLTVNWYCGRRLSTWIVGTDGRGFSSLMELRIISCPMLTEIPSFGSLLLLKKLSIVGLQSLEFLDEGFYGSACSHVVFPALEKLTISQMRKLKTWSLPGRTRQGFPSLKELIIHNCPELMTFPMCFPSLTGLQIDGCHKLFGQEMCGGLSLGNLPALKNLTMNGVHCLESLNEGFYGDYSSNTSFFVALEKLEISVMNRLKIWCFPGGNRRQGFDSLKELQISSCEITKIPFFFPCLTKLGIWGCYNLIEIEMFGGEEGSVSTKYGHSLLSISVHDCPKLEEIPNTFVKLTDVYCNRCYKLASLPRLQNVHKLVMHSVNESMPLNAAIQDSTYLEELSIKSNVAVELLSLDLNRLTSLKSLTLMIPVGSILWENDDRVTKRILPNLSHLQISIWNFQMSAKILTHFSNLNAPITNLELFKCGAVESFSDVDLPSILKSLQITSCLSLKTISDQFLNGCGNSLQELTIEDCPNLVCLPRSLSTFQSIQKLNLRSCYALESLPDGFHKAIALRTLSLWRCSNLIVRKECGFPTALTHLSIGSCLKMKAVSDLQLTKLTSLTHLELEDFPETFTLDGCLPESIEELTITDLPHLESLSGVLPSLKNLRSLKVDKCPLVNQKPQSKKHKRIPQQFKSGAPHNLRLLDT